LLKISFEDLFLSSCRVLRVQKCNQGVEMLKYSFLSAAATSAGNYTFNIQYDGEVVRNATAASPSDCYHMCKNFTSELPLSLHRNDATQKSQDFSYSATKYQLTNYSITTCPVAITLLPEVAPD
jgi:hypothetical protein